LSPGGKGDARVFHRGAQATAERCEAESKASATSLLKLGLDLLPYARNVAARFGILPKLPERSKLHRPIPLTGGRFPRSCLRAGNFDSPMASRCLPSSTASSHRTHRRTAARGPFGTDGKSGARTSQPGEVRCRTRRTAPRRWPQELASQGKHHVDNKRKGGPSP
jgi:hypothetical protein